MRSGFTFKNKHTSEFEGVTVKTRDRPIFPSVKEAVASAAEMDGEYDFTEAAGHEHYNTRNFQMDFFVVASGLSQLQKRLTALSRWFKGRGTLIFDDLPMAKWDVRIIDSVSYMPEHGGGKALVSVTYKAQPFSECIFSVPEGPKLEDNVPLDTDIPLDMTDYLTFSLNGEAIYTDIPCVGDIHIKPIVKIIGATAPIIFTCNGATLQIDGITSENENDTIIIDCEKELVTKSGENIMMNVTGSFGELQPGTDNSINYNAVGGTAQISYVPHFLYDAAFDEDTWGDGPQPIFNPIIL